MAAPPFASSWSADRLITDICTFMLGTPSPGWLVRRRKPKSKARGWAKAKSSRNVPSGQDFLDAWVSDDEDEEDGNLGDSSANISTATASATASAAPTTQEKVDNSPVANRAAAAVAAADATRNLYFLRNLKRKYTAEPDAADTTPARKGPKPQPTPIC
ncbi:hypothetical protein P8C59_006502 [Phyllachora maydis]|uniref:Uncharacterized protein n=1 Tax=Phyllachora maydis TaxID=1825666 RepID=A0AAD9I7Q6_9PEZI|nr:hypothetical protein P8C59_006502 [Phyllachora maydis]